MYVTRPLSVYLKELESLSLPHPDGPNSGVLVIQDEEAESTVCFGLCKSDQVKGLPLPQNKKLRVQYMIYNGQTTMIGPNSALGFPVPPVLDTNSVLFIPVLDQPLSSNRYYVIELKGKHIGEAHVSSTEEDMETCCFCRSITDLEPQPLDPHNIYQQFEIQHQKWRGFSAKSVASDGFPPYFLRREGWSLSSSTPKYGFWLTEAAGLNRALRASLPDFNFTLSEQTPYPVVVGKWYCPFMFVKERTAKEQMNSTYYEMTLEQQWLQIFGSENYHNKISAVTVDVVVENEVVTVAGRKVLSNEREVVDGVMWLGRRDVGLSLAIVDKIIKEEENFGWSGGGGGSEREVRIKMVEEIKWWRKFSCFVLAERFVLKRMDGSLVMTYEFRHTQQIRNKWE